MGEFSHFELIYDICEYSCISPQNLIILCDSVQDMS